MRFQLVGPLHRASVDDPYLMKKAVVVVGWVQVEGCHLPSCRRLRKGFYRTDDRSSHHTQVPSVILVNKYK